MGRPPKVDYNPKQKVTYTKYANTKLNLPSNPFLYKLRRIYWLLANMQRLLETDPTAVPAKQYLELLDIYTTLTEEAVKRGFDSREGRMSAKRRVHIGVVEKEGDADAAAALGDTLPFSVGT